MPDLTQAQGVWKTEDEEEQSPSRLKDYHAVRDQPFNEPAPGPLWGGFDYPGPHIGLEGYFLQGDDWASLRTFLDRLDAYYNNLYPRVYDTDEKRVLAAVSLLTGKTRREWERHVVSFLEGSLSGMTWDDFKNHDLPGSKAPRQCRRMNATRRLCHLRQEPGTTVEDVCNVFYDIMAEMPDELPEAFQASYFFQCLQPELRERIVMKVLDAQYLYQAVAAAKDAESLLSLEHRLAVLEPLSAMNDSRQESDRRHRGRPRGRRGRMGRGRNRYNRGSGRGQQRGSRHT